jgi:hypothetical protein
MCIDIHTMYFLAGIHCDFFILRNYEMKAEIYCFVNLMPIAKYGIFYIIIRRRLPIVESLSSQMKHLIFIILVWDERY